MKSRKFLIFIIILAFSLPYTYGGCVVVFSSGDTNRKKDDDNRDPPIGFIGITSQAIISSSNSEDLSGGAFAGGLTSAEVASARLNQGLIEAQIGAFRPLRFPSVLGNSLRKIELSPALIIFSRTRIITESGNIDGSCGGNFSYTLNLNKLSEKFNGNITFENFCDDEIIISGKTEVDGAFEISSGDFITAIFSFGDLTDGSLTLDGEISLDFSDSPIIATFTATGKDTGSGKVYWIKDYSMNVTELIGLVEIEIFGIFYHPDYGFVNLTTTDPFVVHDGDDWPTSGQLVIEGGKNSKAELTAINHLSCGIETDTDGDGILDWDSGILNWTDL